MLIIELMVKGVVLHHSTNWEGERMGSIAVPYSIKKIKGRAGGERKAILLSNKFEDNNLQH